MSTVWKIVIFVLVSILFGGLIGYVIGKANRIKPKGDILFQAYRDEETDEERIRCSFNLAIDADEIAREHYILLTVTKDEAAKEYYRNMELSKGE